MIRARPLRCLLALALWSATGCATVAPHDYAAYRQHMPRSILVLPPLNESTDVNATYSYLSTISQPLGECGYYVFPVAVVDAFMKDNGLPTPGEMHQVSLGKLREVFGADAVLYVTIEEWGQKYQILSSTTVAKARATLVDTATGTVLWEGRADAVEGSGGSGSLLGDVIIAAIEQVADTVGDQAHDLSRTANIVMVFDEKNGLLYGPYNPLQAGDARGSSPAGGQ